ncbi:MAG: tripartite tricarboxylate transporter TctB family protein [Spirochaetaceae bacterium]|nr:tripartite tricarboxylate transporter TctB family protein [Spirochaetaceae bacterium]
MIHYKPSISHWIFPPIIIAILIILLIVMSILRFIKCRRNNTPFITFKNYQFYEKNYDKIKFYGTFVLFILYIFFMNIIHFLPASIIFIFLFNVLYSGVDKIKLCFNCAKKGSVKNSDATKSLLISLLISVVFSMTIWFIFGQVLKTTLP